MRHLYSREYTDLDVCARKVVFRHDVVLQAYVLSKRHAVCMYRKYASLRLLVWQWKLNLAINSSRSNESWVQRLYTICGHNHLRQAKCKQKAPFSDFHHVPDTQFSKNCRPRGSVRVRTRLMANGANVVPANRVDVVFTTPSRVHSCVTVANAILQYHTGQV